MKKLISLALVVVVVLGCIGLAACNGGDGGGVTTPPPGLAKMPYSWPPPIAWLKASTSPLIPHPGGSWATKH